AQSGHPRDCPLLSASLIGRLCQALSGYPPIPASMSLTALASLRPFHHGIRRRGGTIFWVAPAYVAFAQQPAEIGIVSTLRPEGPPDLGYNHKGEFRR